LSDRSGSENIWTSNIDGSDPKALTKGRNASFLSPSWTADGQYVISSRTTDTRGTMSLWMYHKDGGSGVHIGQPDPPPPPPGAGQPPVRTQNKYGAVASPDGRYIYYASRLGTFTYNAQFPIWQIVRFDRETSEMATLTNAQ